MLDHELEIASEPAVVFFALALVGGGPLAVVLLLETVT
jgi:hypothetical protein